jgi:hypothetical protein
MTMTLNQSTALFTDKQDVESSNIATVYYDADTLSLYVKFHNGSIAAYTGVAKVTYETLIEAQSVGRTYNQLIKGRFRGLNGDVTLKPRLLETPVATTVSNFTGTANWYLDNIAGQVDGQDHTYGNKKFKITLQTVTERTIEVSAASMEEAVTNLDVDGKVVKVEWVL